MTEDELTTLLDRAAGPGDLPPGFTARATSRGRRRRSRHRATAAVVAAVTALTFFLSVRSVPDEPAPTASPLLSRFTAQVPRLADVLFAESLAGYDVVLLREQPGQVDAATGSRAASVWLSNGGPFRELSNYIAYGTSCYEGDFVCVSMRPETGFFTALTTPSGLVLAVVMLPPGSTLTGFDFRTGSRLAAAGPLTRLDLASPTAAWELRPAVQTPDGREYHLPIPVGGVVHADPFTLRSSP
ncbi:hypothetical protein OHA21_04975 [Actinoplanes sp. NBC_00393]|uniref:hypothetical protein n=1 Tax=Actinoplanes sp. NBC_00393 TaxID=2975953 RepID=UPI002E1E3F13